MDLIDRIVILLDDADAGMSVSEIGRALGASRHAVYWTLQAGMCSGEPVRCAEGYRHLYGVRSGYPMRLYEIDRARYPRGSGLHSAAERRMGAR